MVGFSGCKHTLLSHTELVPRVSLDPFSSQLVPALWYGSTQVQELAIGLVKVNEVLSC